MDIRSTIQGPPHSVLQADYSQSAVHFSDITKGKQCVSNCFMYLVMSCLKHDGTISKNDLHAVLESGDILYQLIPKSSELLLVSELPKYIHYADCYFSSFIKHTYFGNMGQSDSELSNSSENQVGMSLERSLNFCCKLQLWNTCISLNSNWF